MVTDRLHRSSPIVVVAATLFVLTILHLSREVLAPLLVACAVAAAFEPIRQGLAARGLPPYVAAAMTALIIVGVVGLVGYLLAVVVLDLGASLGEYERAIARAKRSLIRLLMRHRLKPVADAVRESDPADETAKAVTGGFELVTELLEVIGWILILTTFIQLEAARLGGKIRQAFDQRSETFFQAIRDLQRYLLAKTIISAATGLLAGVATWAFGVENSLAWGLLAFALNYIPVVGSLIAGTAPVAIAWLTVGVGPALGLAAVYIVLNTVLGYGIEPRFVGRALNLSPLAVLVSIVLWGFVLGPTGALLSVPLTIALRLLLWQDERYRWIAILLGRGHGSVSAALDRPSVITSLGGHDVRHKSGPSAAVPPTPGPSEKAAVRE